MMMAFLDDYLPLAPPPPPSRTGWAAAAEPPAALLARRLGQSMLGRAGFPEGRSRAPLGTIVAAFSSGRETASPPVVRCRARGDENGDRLSRCSRASCGDRCRRGRSGGRRRPSGGARRGSQRSESGQTASGVAHGVRSVPAGEASRASIDAASLPYSVFDEKSTLTRCTSKSGPAAAPRRGTGPRECAW